MYIRKPPMEETAAANEQAANDVPDEAAALDPGTRTFVPVSDERIRELVEASHGELDKN